MALLLAGCPSSPKHVAYDLATRTLVAERWSQAEVVLLGTPSAEPALAHGFHREARIDGEPFQWSKGEADVSLDFESVQPREAIVDLAPTTGWTTSGSRSA